MALHINKSKVEPEWYTLESDLKEDNPAEFKLNALTGRMLGEVMEGANFESDNPFTARGVQAALKYGVKGWKNILDQDENEVKFSIADLNKLSWSVRIELASAVIDKSNLSDADAKNS